MEDKKYFFGTHCLVCFIFFLTLIACSSSPETTSQSPLGDEINGESISFLGDTFFRPKDDETSFFRKDSLLKESFLMYQTDTNDLNSIIWYGRRLVSMYRFKEAIAVFSVGIKLHPDAPELYRHRGEQYITLRLPGRAIDDFKKAVTLSQDRNIEIEPDVIPNKLDLPITNLRFNSYYFLGLAWYLQGEYQQAIETFSMCRPYAVNPDLKIAEAYWLCLSFLKSGKTMQADSILRTVDPYAEIIEKDAYHRSMLNLKSTIASNNFTGGSLDSLSTAIEKYGTCIWYERHDRKADAANVRRNILESSDWIDIGYIAAEADSSRLLVQ